MGPAATVNQEFLYSFMKEAVSGANQWTGFYMITASVMKELSKEK